MKGLKGPGTGYLSRRVSAQNTSSLAPLIFVVFFCNALKRAAFVNRKHRETKGGRQWGVCISYLYG